MSVDRARFSGKVAVSNAASTPVLGNTVDRRKLTLTNDGANVIYVELQTGNPLNDDGTVNSPVATVAGAGIRLNANGGSWVEEDYTGPVSAIALVAITDLCVVEL